MSVMFILLFLFLAHVVIAAGTLFLSVILTISIETPMVIDHGVTTNKEYIRGVNMLTNVVFNMILLAAYIVGTIYMILWYALAELLLIPFIEAFMYKKISSLSFKEILKTSYVANIASFLAGLMLNLVIFGLFQLIEMYWR